MAVATHRGMLRAHNEDSVAARAESGLAIVADGMGGHNAGEVASRMAVDLIIEGIEAAAAELAGPFDAKRAEMLIAEHIARANALIHESGSTHPQHAGMGTTVVVAVWYATSVSIGHVGDSRMYRLRAGVLEQLTTDHSLAQEHVDRGTLTRENARSASIRNILTRAVGSESKVSADVNTYAVMPGDVYLLCSDGLTEMLSDAQIGKVLTDLESRLQEAADDLVRKANTNGGVDNISVVIARVADA
jgi:protein phosphatase